MPITGKLHTSDTGYDASGIDLGVINDNGIQVGKIGQLNSIGMPGTDSKDQESSDDSGAEMNITVSGSWLGTSWADGLAWMESILKLITGAQYDTNDARFLALYYKDYYGAGTHLWVLRDDLTLAQNNAGNKPIHVIVESFEPNPGKVGSPDIPYILKVRQQVRY